LAVCVLCLALAWALPAAAGAKYACKCKGIKEWILFVPTYGDCGNGFAGGSKGQLQKNLTEGQLGNYIPPGVSYQVVDGDGCGYYPESGWNCGKMVGSSAPDCVND
jgi:hypothetical protein